MRLYLFFFVCSYSLLEITRAVSVPFIKKCKAEDSKCIKQSTQDAIPIFARGLPQFGVNNLDPLVLKTLDASSPGLRLTVQDLVVSGLGNCAAKKMQRDVKRSKLFVKVQCTAKLEGNYEMNGQILVLPIQGKGKVHAVIRKVVISIEVDLASKVKDGDAYWMVKNWKSSFELKDKSDLEFENLFEGNEILGNAAREVIKSSSNEIVMEIGLPIVNAIISKLVENISRFLDNVPLKELILDYSS